MSEMIKLTPSLLMEQSQEMMSLKNSYDSLFNSISQDLRMMNTNWSDALSGNFSTKISSAQKSFSGVLNMLQNGSTAASMAAFNLSDQDSALAKLFAADGVSLGNLASAVLDPGHTGVMYNPLPGGGLGTVEAWDTLKDLLKETIEHGGDINDVDWGALGGFGKIMEDMGDWWGADIGEGNTERLKSALDVLIGEYGDEGTKVGYGLLKAMEDGDYRDVASYLGGKGIGEYAKVLGEAAGLEKEMIEVYGSYAKNGIENLSSSLTELIMDPSAENWFGLAWDNLVQTGVDTLGDTAGDTIYNTVMMIPGIGDYYAGEGVDDIGGMCNVAMGDLAGMFSNDPGMDEYVSNYYENNGGVSEGIFAGFTDIGNFINEQGGLGNAAKEFIDTAAGDFNTEPFEVIGEKVSGLWKSIF